MKIAEKDWANARRLWESDDRSGYQWLVTELDLPTSAQAVRYRAIKQGWAKDSNFLTVLYGPANAEGYRSGFASAAAKLCLLGCEQPYIAEAFGVPLKRLHEWMAEHAALSTAIERGSLLADAEVAQSLAKIATGYEYQGEQITVVDGQVQRVHVTVTVPPNAEAAIYWHSNRSR